MKRTSIIVLAILITSAVSFIAGQRFATMVLLEERNGIASDNFRTALALFREGYQSKRMIIFGETEESATFTIRDWQFVVIPASRSVSGGSEGPEREIGNMAAHMNGMVVMLACKWIEDGDDRGEQLLTKLREFIPHHQLSAPGLQMVSIRDVQIGSELMESEADQWNWRMGDIDVNQSAEPVSPR